jgi:hypothetical protein
MEERRDAVLHEPSLERRMVASIEGQRQRASGVRNHGVFASSGDGSNRTPRSRTIELPSAGPNAMHGEGVLDQSRARVVTPGYSGHLPGESTRFGMSPTFHRPTSSSSRSSTPRGHHSLRDRTPSSPSVRLSRPTTAWEEIGVGAAARSTSPTRHHHHHQQQQQQYHGWSPRREYKHEVGGVVPGYTGHVPQGATLIGVSQTGGVRTSPARVSHMHSSGGFKSAEERRLAQRGHDHSPLRRGERSAGGSRGDRSHMSPIARSAERFASATVVGYTVRDPLTNCLAQTLLSSLHSSCLTLHVVSRCWILHALPPPPRVPAGTPATR